MLRGGVGWGEEEGGEGDLGEKKWEAPQSSVSGALETLL